MTYLAVTSVFPARVQWPLNKRFSAQYKYNTRRKVCDCPIFAALTGYCKVGRVAALVRTISDASSLFLTFHSYLF